MLSDRTPTAAVLCFCVGILIGTNADGVFLTLTVAISGVLCLALAAAHRAFNFDLKNTAVIFGAALLGVLYVNIYGSTVFSGYDDYIGKSDSITASVTDVSEYAEQGSAILTVSDSGLGLPKNTRVRMWYAGGATVRRGDVISARITYSAVSGNASRADFVQLYAGGEIEDVHRRDDFLTKLRDKVSDTASQLYSGYGNAVSDVAKTVIGVGDGLDSGVYAVYRNAGVSHLLVISGFHVSLIVMAVIYIAMRLGVGINARYLCGVAAALAVAVFVGFTPSIIRSVFMICCMLILKMFLRRGDSLTSLASVLAIIAAFNPFMICSASLQLSFSSCAAIICVQPFIARLRKRIKNRILRHVYNLTALPLLTSVAISIGTLPAMLRFGSVTWISPFVNILVTAVFGYAVALEIAAIMLFALFGNAFSFAAYPSGMFYQLLHGLLEWIYSLKIGGLSTNLPYFSIAILLALFAIIAVLAIKNIRIRSAVTAICVILAAVAAFASAVAFGAYSGANTLILASNDGKNSFCIIADRGNNTYIDLGGYRNEVPAAKYGYDHIGCYVLNSLDKYSLSRFERAASSVYIDTVVVPYDSDMDRLTILYDIAEGIGCDIKVYDIAASDKSGNITITNSRAELTGRACILFGEDNVGCSSDVVIALDGFRPCDDALYFAGTLISSTEAASCFMYDKHFSTDLFGNIKVNITNECEVSLLEH